MRVIRPKGIFPILLILSAFLLGFFLRGSSWLSPTAKPPAQKTASESAAPIVRLSAKVTRVIDGDTVVLDDGRHVRYLGIDSPERRERWGEAAKNFNAELVLNKNVVLELDGRKYDAYDRLLAYIFVGDDLINEKLLAEGLAKTLFIFSDAPLRYRDRLLQAEEKAHQDHNGVWLDEWERQIEKGTGN